MTTEFATYTRLCEIGLHMEWADKIMWRSTYQGWEYSCHECYFTAWRTYAKYI